VNVRIKDILYNTKYSSLINKAQKWLVIIIILFVAILPLLGVKISFRRVVIQMMIYACLALSLNLTTGYTGLVSLGHAAYFSIGAFTAAVMSTKLGTPFIVNALCAAIIAGIAGLIVGFPSLFLTGAYLSIVTLGFMEIVRTIELAWESVTNGSRGIRNIPKPSIFGVELSVVNNGAYYLIFVMLLLVSLFCWLLIKSKYGRALMAIKEDEQAAIQMGLKTFRYKMLAFVFSATIAGFVGAFYAHIMGYIDPYTFSFDTSILILCIVILGGMGTMRGMYLGSAVLVFLPELLRGFDTWRFVVYGLILVLMMRFRPQGILGWKSKHPYRFPKDLDKTEVSKEL